MTMVSQIRFENGRDVTDAKLIGHLVGGAIGAWETHSSLPRCCFQVSGVMGVGHGLRGA
jgi:hypothetical protein